MVCFKRRNITGTSCGCQCGDSPKDTAVEGDIVELQSEVQRLSQSTHDVSMEDDTLIIRRLARW